MIKAISQMFAALFTLFSAAEKGASAVHELTIWAEEEARGMRIQAQKEREAKLAELEADLEDKSTGTES